MSITDLEDIYSIRHEIAMDLLNYRTYELPVIKYEESHSNCCPCCCYDCYPPDYIWPGHDWPEYE